MQNKIPKKIPQAKSYTSIYEIFGSTPFSNVLYRNHKKVEKEHLVCTATYCEPMNKCDLKMSAPLNQGHYVTSEKYHALNKQDGSEKSVIRSTSTIFYDLDDVAKRHSFHCLAEISISNANILKAMKLPVNTNVFGGKSDAIVQECATQIQPKLLARDSIEINTKKVKKSIHHSSVLSSEIFLRDEEYLDDYHKNHYYDRDSRPQKFWSYAKYRTEYTKPVSEEKKSKKKDRGKRTEDPCPCQLFSYACPCTDKKSLTELAKNSKSLTVTDQITSTTKIRPDDGLDLKTKKQKHNAVKEDKPTNTCINEVNEIIILKKEPPVEVASKHDMLILTETNQTEKLVKNKSKSQKKPRIIICPNCKEKVDVISITEEEGNLRCDSSFYRSKEMPSTAAYTCRASSKTHKNSTVDDGEVCNHDPRCELVPVCQILPTDDNIYISPKCIKNQSSPKSTPRVIRITKACRHHPPCTVVPSCQRANVLKNNCEYIPPCLHRPRCVNLPLCVPFSKSLHYDEVAGKHISDMENTECRHIPTCKYVPICQQDCVLNNVDPQIQMVSRMQNACEFLNGYQTPTFLINPQANCMPHTYSPCQVPSPDPCNFCRSNKFSQYDYCDYKCDTTNAIKDDMSTDTVIFIRDVGCQFRNKGYSPKESVLQAKTSSGSFDFVNVKMGNYYTNVHTLRYEDKFTSPLSGRDLSLTSGSITSSVEVDANCPSHGRGMTRSSPKTGFSPKTAYVTAFSTHTDPVSRAFNSSKKVTELNKSDIQGCRECHNPFPVKSRRSFLKSKYKKMFSSKRRRKSRVSNRVLSSNSRKFVYQQ